MSYKYDSEFFDFVNTSAGKSASKFIDLVQSVVFGGSQINSVIDVGCGRGVWAAEWRRRGAARVVGVDGDYVPPGTLLIPRECFIASDLSKPLDVGDRFELVQCLEVAEHLPPDSSETLIDGLVRHGDVVLFSAAVPGQGGEHHVNERSHGFWRARFASRGFQMYDAVRPLLQRETDVEPWYRYNSFIYASPSGAARISARARATLLPSPQPIPSFAPLSWRARCLALSLLPSGITNLAARAKHRLANRFGAGKA
jgi:hypothetical protein